jgi:small subunit ribosomal protein S13
MAEEKKKKPMMEESNEILVRIAGQDIPGSKNLYSGLTRVKGISWVVSKIVCNNLGLDKKMKVSDLDKASVQNIEKELENLNAPDFVKNRRGDFDSGKDMHLLGIKLDMRKEFDIKRLKKIKSYRGTRHTMKLPVRGQRTRSNFRKVGIAVGVKKPKIGKKG